MKPVLEHPWDLSEKDARILQERLASRVIISDEVPRRLELVAGVDVAYGEDKKLAFAAAVVLDWKTLRMKESVCAESTIRFPYVPGLLSFREIPAIEKALKRLVAVPDLLVCDGHGIAHPRRFGLASHLGVLFDLPTIGCAKSGLRLVAVQEPATSRGSLSALVGDGQLLGAVLRTRDHVKPVYVSPGHRLSVTTACELVLKMCAKFRIPEPIRFADQMVNPTC